MSILTLQKITQEFGGLRALHDIDLNIEEKEIFGIIGPNGAGKTTLFNLITGMYVPTAGELLFKGRRLNRLSPYNIARLGIGRTFQNIRLFNQLSVMDNVKVGSYAITRAGFVQNMLGLPRSRREEHWMIENATALLKLVGLHDKKDEYASSLAYGEQRRLEIARALALKPALLLLDEPAAGMTPAEKEELMGLIRHIREAMGVTIILVEHDMNLVMRICEKIAVLNYGRKIAEGSPDEVKNNQQVIQSYLG
jgi:branched-chain amino acid transport system ATP-binding protein